MAAAITNRLTNLLEKVGAEISAPATGKANGKPANGKPVKQANEDPGSQDGSSSHPTASADNNEQKPPEGERTSENASYVKENIPSAVDSTSPATPDSVPTAEEAHLAPATSTGKDSANEKPDTQKTDDPGFIGGETAHPTGEDKYASLTRESVLRLSDAELIKISQDLGGEVLADVATGYLSTTKQATAPATPTPAPAAKTAAADQAAAAGYKAATDAAAMNKLAGYIEKAAQEAWNDAELVYAYLCEENQKLGSDLEDASGPAAEGEDHGSEVPPGDGAVPPDGGGAPPPGGPPGAGPGADLMALMGGGGDPGGAPAGPDPAAAMGGAPPGDMGAGGPPPEMGGMGQDEALQHLAMALLELGIDPAQLAAAAGPGPKMAEKIAAFKGAGKFRFTESKTAREEVVRGYMKRFVRELVSKK
jgi:hypothetical protein